MQPNNPDNTSTNLSLSSPTTFGVITSQSNTPRNLEFGACASTFSVRPVLVLTSRL